MFREGGGGGTNFERKTTCPILTVSKPLYRNQLRRFKIWRDFTTYGLHPMIVRNTIGISQTTDAAVMGPLLYFFAKIVVVVVSVSVQHRDHNYFEKRVNQPHD